MLNILEAYIDLNELENKQQLMNAGAELEHYDDKELVSLARLGYVVTGRMKHVRGDWTLEQFMQMGDAGLNQLDLEVVSDDHMEMFPVAEHMQGVLGNMYRRHAPAYLAKYLELDDMFGANTVFILEQQVRDDYTHQQVLQSALEEQQSSLVIL